MPIQLTPEQRNILEASDQNLYISSAPGSGKSTMLSHICARLLLNPTNKVMLLTFTNKASESIISKCENLDKTRIIAGTFHSVAYRILKQNGCKLSICDEHKKRMIIKTVFNCRKDKEKLEQLYEHISDTKGKHLESTDASVLKYNQELKRYNLLDFDDIISQFIKEAKGELPQLKVPAITHCLVDELQDTSGLQLEMLKQIFSQTNCKAMGVADDDQCIYAWRGARPENVQDFISIFGCKIMNMGVNFRSDKRIVKHSVELIKNNKKRIDKIIKTNSSEDGKIFTYKCNNPFDEVSYVVIKCQQNPDTNIAILYRNRSFKYHLEFELRKANLKYKVNDFLDITDRSAVRVMISCLKIACNQYDIFDLTIAAKALKGLGEASIKKIKEETEAGKAFKEIIAQWLSDPKKKKKLASIEALQKDFTDHPNSELDVLVRLVENHFIKSFNYQEEMRAFLIDITKSLSTTATDINTLADELGLNGKEDPEDSPDAKIELSTVHGYKGLEQPVIIMPFCQMYLEPKPGKSIDLEDERRLFYVGITRAKNKLYLSYSGAKPRFIEEMKL